MPAPNKLIEKIEGFTRKYYLNRLIQGVLVGAVLWIVFYLLITEACSTDIFFRKRIRLTNGMRK